MNTNIKINNQFACGNLPNSSIHSIFEYNARNNPSNKAIVFEEQYLTYEELNNRSNKVADYLIEKNINSEDLIGIFCTRSFEMIIGILGILKAGGAYVPLDPEYPSERLSYMINEANLSLILTNAERSEKLSDISEFVNISSIMSKEYNAPTARQSVNHDNLAYVIFTSGSSGTPKASLLEHKGLINIAHEQVNTFDLDKNSRVLQFASLSFDAATWEWVMALCSGASLYLLNNNDIHSPEKLNQYVVKHQISHATIPPALLPSLDIDSWTSVSHLIVAGESCNLNVAKQWSHGRNFYNAYGPSEVTICTTIAKFSNSVEKLHLGKPILNTCVYIMDDQFNQVREGELYIGGIGLSRGYINRDELNSQKFINNPDKYSSFNRLYRSGDVVRLDSNGEMIFVGRLDNQVKIRGNRVELGEIESVLLSHPQVIQAVAMAKDDARRGQVLLAWIVIDKENLSINELDLEMEIRQTLMEKLPDFMQVSRVVILDEMPLTPNKKIDKYKLPIPDISKNHLFYSAPETDTEKKLCRIWQEILGISKVGTMDNFHWLGGNSLSAVKIISNIKKEFNGKELLFSQFMESENIKNLAQVISDDAGETWDLPAVKVASINSASSVSPIQRSTLLIQSMAKNIPYCNTPIVFSIDGNLNFNALRKAIKLEIGSHEALRSFFTYENGDWIQTIKEEVFFDYEFSDISNDDNKEYILEKIIEKNHHKIFDLSIEIPLKVFLVKMGINQYICTFILHQIAFDGHSTALFMSNVSKNYNYLSGDSTGESIENTSIQYIDYTSWRELLRSCNEYQKGLAWWKQYLHTSPELHSIPLDFPRPAQQSYRGKTLEFKIEAYQYKKIQRFSRDKNYSLFTLLQAVFWIFIGHYSNKTDIVTGTVSNGRLKDAFQACMGNFANILVLRKDITDDLTFEDFVEKVKINIENAFDKQWIFFDDLVEYLNPRRSLSHGPLVQIMLVFQDEKQGYLNLNGLTTKNIFHSPDVAKFDLALHVYPEKNKIRFSWEYNTALFKESTISRLHSYLINVLMQGISSPFLTISELKLVPDNSVNSILKKPSYGTLPEPRNVYLLFRENVDKYPDQAAIYEGHYIISYRDLHRKVQLIADQLQTLIVDSCKQELIAVCMKKSINLLASMLAIFKLGQIYLPIDPTYPHERISYIIKDANASIIVTDDGYEEMLSSDNSKKYHVLNIEQPYIDQPLVKESHSEQMDLQSITRMAYVIYTSGSTGNPKGVLVSHRNLFYSLFANRQCFGVTAKDVIPAIGSQAFGVSILEFLMPLSCGGAVRIISPETVKDVENLIKETQDATILHAVPSLMKNWLQTVVKTPGIYPKLRVLLTGGEAVPIQLLHGLRDWNSRLKILATYGMTEATVICAAYEASSEHTGSYYLGKAHVGSYFRVLNRHLQQQPPGVSGELYVGGLCIAEGYRNRPELNQLKFIKDPYDNRETLYQTGDLVRIVEDGNLEFLGRVDNQINLRGIRIEYGEIESLLRNIKEVQQAVVSIKTLDSGEDALVAYISFKPKMEKSTSEIRDHLRRFLPDYMCPNLFVILDHIPLNPNGKIDRQALPLPVIDAYGTDPKTETEKTLALIWQDILSLPYVSVDKNFFELGGNSLLMTKVINRIFSTEKVHISLTNFFNSPTINDLAIEVDKAKYKQLIMSLTIDQENHDKSFNEIVI